MIIKINTLKYEKYLSKLLLMNCSFYIEPEISVLDVNGIIDEEEFLSQFRDACGRFLNTNSQEILVDLRQAVIRIGYDNYRGMLNYLDNLDVTESAFSRITILTKSALIQGYTDALVVDLDITHTEVEVVTDPRQFREYDQKIRSLTGFNRIHL